METAVRTAVSSHKNISYVGFLCVYKNTYILLALYKLTSIQKLTKYTFKIDIKKKKKTVQKLVKQQ